MRELTFTIFIRLYFEQLIFTYFVVLKKINNVNETQNSFFGN